MRTFDLIIVGSGSGNSLLDERFADWDVAIVERGVFGGTCLNVGCIPTKMFVHTADLAAAPADSARFGVDATLRGVRWRDVRDRIFDRIDPIAAGGRQYRAEGSPNVTLHQGTAAFAGERVLRVDPGDGGPSTLIQADQIVLATGSRPFVPAVPGLAEAGFHTSDTVMRLDELPARMVILGGGFVAAEFAHVFSSFGVEVTVVNRGDALLRAEDGDVSRRFTELASQRWDVRLGRTALRATRSGGVTSLVLWGPDGEETVEAEEVLVATGRVPNSDLLEPGAAGLDLTPDGRVRVDEYQRTSLPGVWALGDLSSPFQLKHVANHETRVVRHNLLCPDDLMASDHRHVPHAVFSSPQVASVGLTEEEARARGVRHVTAVQDYGDVAYGWALEDSTGFCKLVADPETGALLGAHLIGPEAATLIQPLIQAISFGLPATELPRRQYWIHPALPELVENALLKLPLA
ncbi:mycothione reductase [Actinoalloteichus caeruleus]|uniref:Mycothione reductase n=1 Tax=Actinoalloteichus caeruleus DSM 43889 TaxID=1120930 RepID=A0ABT1JPE1_ACTCY|nr:mycothione reductase [Actinoalloteichus caeruleus]MCP2334386.1 mycothione reductase [Actinoalloteichus caeruleus DSM 43889]